MRRIVLFVLVFAIVPRPGGAQPRRQASPPPEDAGYYFMVARYLETTGKPAEAVTALQKAITLEPKSAELRAELAGIYARQERAVEALNTAEEALTFDPANREANRVLGSIFAALSEQKSAIRDGDDPAQYQSRAIAALEKGRPEAGADLGLELTLGELYLRAGQPAKAVASLLIVFEQQPEYSDGGLLLAAAQQAAGNVDAAIVTLESTVQHNPKFSAAYPRLIELYEQQRRWKEAAGAYAALQALEPAADVAGGRALALLNSGAAAEAKAVLESALAKQPLPDAMLLYLLAQSQQQLRDLPGAAATVETLRAKFPEDPRGLVAQMQLLVAQGKTDEAIVTLADLIKRLPSEPSFVYQYARLLDQRGRAAEADQALRALLAREPRNADALNELGYRFAERGERLPEAIELLQRALEVDPGNPSYLDSLGWAFFKQGQFAQADRPLAEAAAKSPRSAVIQSHLGDLRYRQERYADAVLAWERALSLADGSVDKAAIQKKLNDARQRAGKK